MAGPLLAPGVYSQEEQTVAPIPAQAATVGAMLGLAERGPVDEDVESSSFDEWGRTFGAYTLWNLATVANVRQFFDNGGQVLRFTRVVHHSDVTNPASKTSAKASKTLQTASLVAGSGTVLSANAAPYDLEPGQTLVVGRDALGNATATFNAAAAVRSSGNAAPFALANNDTLTLAFDGGSVQTVTVTSGMFVAIGAATAAEVAAAINGQITGGKAVVNGSNVDIKSDKRGLGSGVNITGGSANAGGKLNYTTGNIAGTGNVQNIDAVTSAEVKTIVEAAVSGVTVTAESSRQRITSNTTGGSSSVQVQNSSTSVAIGFDNAAHTGNAAGAVDTLRIDAKSDGTYGNEVTPQIAAPSNGTTGNFNLIVIRNGVILETWPNLTMVDTDPRYVEKIVNNADEGSLYVQAVDLDAAIAFPLDVPATGSFGALTGGSDGLASLDDNDFIGGSSANGNVGMRTFDDVEPDLLMCPERATPAAHNAMITYCITTMNGKTFPVLDPPAGYSDTQIETYFTTTAALRELSEFGAIHWPRIKVANPNRALYGDAATVVAPTSGTVAGICCRIDGLRVGGQFDQPAGTGTDYLPRNVLGLENDAVNKKAVRDRLDPLGINCIRKSKKGPIFVDGSNVLKQTGSWPSIGQRRGIIFVERQLEAGLEFAAHRGITPDLLRDEKAATDEFMLRIVEGGNLASRVPSEAFFTDFGPGLNKPSTKRAKTTKGRLGVATAFPNKFTVLLIGPDNRAFEAELAASSG